MPDVQFHPLGTEDAPADWELPQSLEIIPKCIRAVFDGSAAASTFRPSLVIVSDSGREIGRFPVAVADAVAAGGSAEVTWFPGGRVAGGGGGAAGLSVAFARGSAAQITAPATNTYITTDEFITNDAAAFTTGTTVIGGNTYTGVVFLEQGTYYHIAAAIGAAGGAPVVAGDAVSFSYVNGGDPFGNYQGSNTIAAPSAALAGSGYLGDLSFIEAIAVKSTDVPPPTTPLIYLAYNATAGRGRVGFKSTFVFVANTYPSPGL